MSNKNSPNKVLLVVPENSSFNEPIKSALLSLRIEVINFDNRSTLLVEKFIFASSLFINPLYLIGVRSINKRILRAVKITVPDLVIVVKGENILTETINKIKELCPVINYFPDYLRFFPGIIQQIDNYSYFFHLDQHETEELLNKGHKNIAYLPFATETNPEKSKKIYNLVFIGTYSPAREELLRSVSDLGLFIWGSEQWGSSSLASNYQKQWLTQEEMYKIFHKSKIIINIHQNSLPENDAANLRCFEVTGSGEFLLTDYRKSFKSLFVPGKEIITYQNKDELREEVQYYLNHDDERQIIAENGLKRVLKEHSYEKRLEVIFKKVFGRS